jgi:hypothetical protein
MLDKITNGTDQGIDFQSSLAFQGAFPNCYHSPSSCQQKRIVSGITRLVATYLVLPKISICRRNFKKFAIMAVPETAIYEKDGLVFR